MKWNNNGCDTNAGYWITQVGEKINIKDMRTDHIRNCILYVETYGGKLRKTELDKIDELEEELFKRRELGIRDE